MIPKRASIWHQQAWGTEQNEIPTAYSLVYYQWIDGLLYETHRNYWITPQVEVEAAGQPLQSGTLERTAPGAEGRCSIKMTKPKHDHMTKQKQTAKVLVWKLKGFSSSNFSSP